MNNKTSFDTLPRWLKLCVAQYADELIIWTTAAAQARAFLQPLQVTSISTHTWSTTHPLRGNSPGGPDNAPLRLRTSSHTASVTNTYTQTSPYNQSQSRYPHPVTLLRQFHATFDIPYVIGSSNSTSYQPTNPQSTGRNKDQGQPITSKSRTVKQVTFILTV